MTSAPSAEKREDHRERLYRNYLEDQFGAELPDATTRFRGSVPYFKKLAKHLPERKDARILDLGCGSGMFLSWLKKIGYQRIEGIDRSPEQVRTAHAAGLDCVKQGDLTSYLAQCGAEQFDVVLALDVLEHFVKEDAFGFVDEVSRVLKPGGLFILHMPNGEGFLSNCVIYDDLTHELTVTRHSLRQLLRSAGFSQSCSYEDAPIVHGFLSAARFLIWKVVRGILRLIYAAQTGNSGRNLILSPNFLTVARKA